MAAAPPCALIIFGASGDLANRKLLPAIYQLLVDGLLNERTYVLGYSRTEMSDEQFRRSCREAIEKHARSRPINEQLWKELEARLHYHAADYGSPEDHSRMAATLAHLDARYQSPPNRLFYLATPPQTFSQIIQRLGERRLGEKGRGHDSGWQRIIIEKPFGRDLGSARELNQLLHRYFSEDNIFRIDHYLGKETVQNLLVFRFANSVFEPIWNYKYVDHVQITVAEELGVAGRGGYYDKTGALRDMVQNHLLQLTALIAMEPPAALDALSIRDEKVKVFKSIRRIHAGDVEAFTRRGQYGASERKGAEQPGYREEKGVAEGSKTETFVALKLFVDNWRWSGMPFYLRTGKCLPEKLSEVVVRFRSPPLALFQKQCESPVYPNDLVVRVQPDEGISFRINGKVPGGQLNIKPVALDFFYKTTFHLEPPEAYERLIYDAMTGDQTLFIRADEVEAAWAVIDPIEEGWARSDRQPEPYQPGVWGPKSAASLIEQDGRRWAHAGEPQPIIACSL